MAVDREAVADALAQANARTGLFSGRKLRLGPIAAPEPAAGATRNTGAVP